MTLYNSEILKLATSTANFRRLPKPHASVEKRSPVCGSRVTVDVRLDSHGHIDALGLEVRACALDSARDALAAFLAETSTDPGIWPGLQIFAPAVPHRARHASILLAFDAVAEAAREAAH
jgi:NifU-like protein involved in Fe-S cluster formation